MSAVLHREAIVKPDGTIEIATPELQPGQHVSITIEPDQQPDMTQAPTNSVEPKRHAIDILGEMPGQRVFKTAEEVDAYLREERESWDR